MKLSPNHNESKFITDVKQMLVQARQNAYKAINSAMVQVYWNIGRRIVEEEQNGNEKANYGEAVLKNLSIALTQEFGNGFSYANLRNFRQFYLTYPHSEICYTVRSKLTWSHNRLIMRIDDENARNYYLHEAAEQNWSVRTLERNIHTLYYQRVLSSQNKKKELQPEHQTETQTTGDFIKDPYVFEFLNLPEPVNATETQIESALIENLQKFLLELGKGFAFIGRQFRISTETTQYLVEKNKYALFQTKGIIGVLLFIKNTLSEKIFPENFSRSHMTL